MPGRIAVLPTSPPHAASSGLGVLSQLCFIKIRGFCALQCRPGYTRVPAPHRAGETETSIPRSQDSLSDSSCGCLELSSSTAVEDPWHHWEALCWVVFSFGSPPRTLPHLLLHQGPGSRLSRGTQGQSPWPKLAVTHGGFPLRVMRSWVSLHPRRCRGGRTGPRGMRGSLLAVPGLLG